MPNVVEVIITGKNLTGPAIAEAEGSALSLGKVMSAVGTLGVAAVAGIAYESTKMAVSFDSAMTMINTQAGVSKNQIGALSQGVLSLAGQVGFSPDSLADALYHIESSFASVGIKGPAALNLLKTAAEGAAVGHANLVDVTNALDAVIASGIGGVKSYSAAMGILNATVGAGDMKMQDLADAFGTGLLASVKGFGVGITDVGAALAVFGDNNIRGAKAGTDLRMAIQALAAPTKAGDTIFKSWGMTQSQLADDMRTHGLLFALEDLQKNMRENGVTASEQGQIITEAFGKKAGVGLSVLMGQMDRLKSKYPDLTKAAGGFGNAVATNNATAAQKLKDLQASFDALMVEIGNKVLPILVKFLDFLTAHFKVISEVTLAVIGLAAACKIASIAMGLIEAVAAAGPWGLIAIAVIALAVVIVKYHKQIADFVVKTWNDIYKFTVTTWDSIYQTGSQIWNRIYNDTIGVVIRLVSGIKSTITSGFDSWWTTHGEAVKQVWTDVWTTVTAIFKLNWAIVSGAAKVAWDALSTLFKVTWDVLEGTVSGGWDVISTAFKVAFSVIEGIAKSGWDVIAAAAKVVWAAIQFVLKTAWDVIVGLFSVFIDVLTGHWTQAGRDIQTAATQVWNNVKGFLGTTWNAISGLAVQIFNNIKDTVVGAFKSLLSGVSALGSDFLNAGKAVMTDLWNGIKAGASGIVSWLSNFASSVVNVFKTIWGWFSPSRVMYEGGKALMEGIAGGVKDHAGKAIAQAAQAAKAVAAAGSVGGSGGSVQALMQKMAAARGWTGAQWQALNNVEMAEAGYNLNARNPSSGAYGLAQFINGPGEYATYGGNANTAAGQITGMLNYIAQRYGNPANAWAHEQAYHWYAAGGATSPGWAMVGEHGRELVKLPGGANVYSTQDTHRMAGAGAAGGVSVQLEVAPGGDSAFEQFMVMALREWVRTKGGGNVQKAFGRA